MYVMVNKCECQQGVSSRLIGQRCWNHGRQRWFGPGEPTTDWCWSSVENVKDVYKSMVGKSRLA